MLKIDDFEKWESLFKSKIMETVSYGTDPGHDLAHFLRVVKSAKYICSQEGGNLNIVLPAAWLHDMVYVSKSDPNRSKASQSSAKAALKWLKILNYPEQFLDDIFHAIEAHSFSAQIETQTLEAKIIQDADRLDAIGAIGIARCFSVGGLLNRPLYHWDDPEAKFRSPDDTQNTLDHFWVKLFKLRDSFKTDTAKHMAQARIDKMKRYVSDLLEEIS